MSTEDILQPLPFEKWPLLAESLKNNWPAYGHYYNIVKNQIEIRSKEPTFQHEIFCPGGDHNSGVFVALSSFATYELVLFATEGAEDLLHKAVTETSVINWNLVTIAAIHFRLVPTIDCIIETLKKTKGMEVVWRIPGNCFFKSKEECAAVEFEIPEGCYIKELEESHVPLIHSVWPHRMEDHPEISTKFVLTILKINGGLGLFSKDNNELLSWALLSNFGALSLIQTIERCKRRGYAKTIVNAFAKEYAERGYDSYAFIVEGNRSSVTMFESLGWKKIYSHDWIQLKKTIG